MTSFAATAHWEQEDKDVSTICYFFGSDGKAKKADAGKKVSPTFDGIYYFSTDDGSQEDSMATGKVTANGEDGKLVKGLENGCLIVTNSNGTVKKNTFKFEIDGVKYNVVNYIASPIA